MTETIIAVVITGACSLLGTIITVIASSRKTEENIRVHQAETDIKIEHLTNEVRSHNDFARRIPVIEEKISVANHRIDGLEQKVG